jgi:hypothetical protein
VADRITERYSEAAVAPSLLFSSAMSAIGFFAKLRRVIEPSHASDADVASRRRFLGNLGGLTLIGVAAVGTLGACGVDDGSSTQPAASAPRGPFGAIEEVPVRCPW